MTHGTLTVRVSQAGDIAAIDALLARSYPALLKQDYPPSVMVTAIPLISRAQPGLITSGTYYVAEGSGARLLGVGGWTPSRITSGAAEFRHFATDPDAVRQGVGRALLLRVFDEAQAAGFTRFDCMATRTAVPFYQAMGFVPLGPVEVTLGPAITFPVVQMQRRVQGA